MALSRNRTVRPGAGKGGLAARASFFSLAILMAALAIAMVAAAEIQDRARRLDAARREAATLTRTLEEQTASVIWAADFVLRGLSDRLVHEPSRGEHDLALEESMRRRADQLPGVRALFVIGPDGYIIQDSDYPSTPRRNLRDRDYFRAQAVGPNPYLFVGLPLHSRSVDSWFVGVSRRIEGLDGKFIGVAVAALETSYFETLYADLDLGPGHVVMLATRDGILVSRAPPAAGQVSRPLTPDSVRQRLALAMNGTAAGTFDEPDRIVAYRALRAHPLVVVVGLSRAQVLQPWWHGAIRIAGLAAVAIGLSLLILWLAMRHARREEEARARIAQAAKLEAIARLTSGVAHDFNNILQALGSLLSGLKTVNADPEAARALDQGQGSIQRGRGLVARLLAISRPQQLGLQPVDVSALVRDMESLLASAAGRRIRIETDLAEGLPPARTDPSRLEAAILNLVVNAKDAVPAGRVGRVRIRTAARPGGFVCISVADDGTGMTDEVRRQILEPFFTTKGEAGTGLGLAQVDMFMRETGGELRIETQVDTGTEVLLLLPSEAGGDQADSL